MLFEDSLHPKLGVNKDGSIILDHSRVIVISQMLNSCYKEPTILFLNSNRNIIKYFSKLYDDDANLYLVYLDVSVDNINTVLIYEQLLKMCIVNKLKGLIIVPIPCVEYYVIKCFGGQSEDYSIVCNISEYIHTKTCTCNMKQSRKSFEKYCKAVMSKIVPQQYRGTVLESDFKISKSDCLKLLQSFPVYLRLDEVHSDSHINLIECLNTQFQIILHQYGVYSSRSDFIEFDLLELKRLYSEYIKYLSKNIS